MMCFIREYEYRNGRLNIQKRNALGLVDFTSEGTKDDTRFIIVTDSLTDLIRNIKLEDYLSIELFVYIYVIEDNEIREEIPFVQITR
ncbi:hypothetical protein [Peribacillus sp. SCS-155]|uniref:hypothetical protein n=1 Tax=Peribacillus sedimenti TaxID=3115297 RepID=UPI0039066DE0